MATVDVDRDAARDAAQHELSKAIYPKGSLSEQVIAWIERLLYRITAGAASVPGGWFTIAILLILLAVALIVAMRIARRTLRTNRNHADTLFDDHELTAAEHRAIAQRHAAAGDWAHAIRHGLRAVARQLEENGVLDPAPGRTATELGRTAGRALPGLSDRFSSAAGAFNDVTYGELPGHEQQYRMISALDDEVLRGTSSAAAGSTADAPPHTWAEVR